MELSAVFFDVDGTVAETENYHGKHLMMLLKSLIWIGFRMRPFTRS